MDASNFLVPAPKRDSSWCGAGGSECQGMSKESNVGRFDRKVNGR